MKGYVFSIVGTVLLSTIVICVLPDGKTAVTIKGVAKCFCVLIIISPILTFFQSNGEEAKSSSNSQINFLEADIEMDSSFIQYFSNERVLWTQTQLERELQERYNLYLTVVLEWEWRKSQEDGVEGIYIYQIRVQGVAQETEKTKKEILEYLTQNYCEEVLLE